MAPKQDIDERTRDLPRQLQALARSAHPGLLMGCRLIAAGDEFALTDAELFPIGRSVVSVRRASGAARIVAKDLLVKLGGPPHLDIPKTSSGAPRWPPGFVGSLAHDDEVAVAVVARSQSLPGAGIDVEPALPLPANLLHLVATRSERRYLNGDLVMARLLFCIKEAVYKATHPLDGLFLDHHDIEVCLNSSTARTSSGHRLQIHTSDWPRLIALALLV